VPETFLADQRTASVIIPLYSLYQRHLLALHFNYKHAQHIRQVMIKKKILMQIKPDINSQLSEKEGEQKADKRKWPVLVLSFNAA